MNYAAAKAGIASMTIVMARELERIGVRVNAIAPVARTRLTEAVAGDFMNAKEGEFDRFAPENPAAVAVWLASPLAAGITGQVVKVQGGQRAAARGLAAGHRGDADDGVDARLDRGEPRRAARRRSTPASRRSCPPVEG